MSVQELAASPLFAGLDPAYLEKLARIALLKKFERGQTVFAEGDPGNGFYLVQSGRFKIFKLSFDGKEQILHLLGAGEPFGEVAVFTGRSFPAAAEAMEKGRAFFFARDDFVRLIATEPSLAMNMLAVLSMRLKKFAQMIESLSLKEVPGRLATHLLLLSDQQDGAARLRLSITKAQLASLLGTIPETLSRILAKMSREGFIALDGPMITIANREGLAELAMGAIRI
ncbi:MAG: transcriptional regulator [Deltaproteobacteria bacterium CG_4_10_14_3_um_filter_60_8]|nr:MAG: transcriptional regulator [Desulfobacterales bacterium CG2_30_60_27]PIP42891.1 MAG: transcriptional regulator [Deltaproteobacteria bacterium CG23_combo_of_CG06-09_8_20_14_all_60_8]PIY20421.1 MAG: transcriptional regulator [Deltaproteobacteria bacterium CG_4_10_14_3_um_filter_60_8]